MRNAFSAAESISSDAIADLFDLIVDGVGWAGSACAVDIDEASDTNACQSVDIELLVVGAVRPTDS